MLIFENGVAGYIETNRLPSRKERSLLVVGERASVIVDYLNKTLTIVDLLKEEEVPIFGEEPLKIELSHFVDSILKDSVPLTSGIEGLRALEIAEAALRSAKEGRKISITYLQE
jgi:predicted dehydrogenase